MHVKPKQYRLFVVVLMALSLIIATYSAIFG